MSRHGLIAQVSVDLVVRSLMYVILRTSPGEARITGATVPTSKANASRPFSFTACSVRDTTCFFALTSGGSGSETLCAQPLAAKNIGAPARSSGRRQLIVL